MVIQIGLQLLLEAFISLGARKEKIPRVGDLADSREWEDKQVRKPRLPSVSHPQILFL